MMCFTKGASHTLEQKRISFELYRGGTQTKRGYKFPPQCVFEKKLPYVYVFLYVSVGY